MDQPKEETRVRRCTCHPDDATPKPCAQRFALRECQTVAVLRAIAAIPTVGSEGDRADNDEIEVRGFAIHGAHYYLPASIIDWARSAVVLYDATVTGPAN